MSIAVDSARGLVYVDAVSGENPPEGYTFGIINVTSHALVKTLPLGELSGPVVLDQGTGDVFVGGNTTIAVLDGGNRTFVRQFSVGRPILSMAHDGSVSPDIFFTSGAQLFAVDPKTGAIVGNATFSSDADGMAVDPVNGRIYVGLFPSPLIAVLNASSLAEVGTIQVPACCAFQFSLDQRTQTLYSSTGTNYVYAVDAATDTYLRELQVSASPQNSTNFVVADNETGDVFAASSPGGSIVELNGATGAVLTTFKVSSQAAGIALDTKTHELYATNYHQLTVFDVGRGRGYLLLLVVAASLIVAAVLLTLIVSRWKEARERKSVQSNGRPTGPDAVGAT
jgi:outer membrane protein assembly factor BamB